MAKILTLLANFEQVLLYADGPQVVLLGGPADSKIVAVAVHKRGMVHPFFAGQVSSEQFYDYLSERFDLRYLLLKPDFRRHFIFDLARVGDNLKVELQRYKFDAVLDEALLPESGLFSRDHTEEVKSSIGEFLKEETFGIDGKWDLPEFSRFYGQVTDLYSMFNGIDIFLNEQEDIDHRQRVQQAFIRPFEGGGSYVGLYDSLATAAPRQNRLRVESVSYHSPGFVKVSGRQKPLAEVRGLIGRIEADGAAIGEDFRMLDRWLRESNLRKFPAHRFTRRMDSGGAIEALAHRLTEALDVVAFPDLLRMSGGNVLIAAKVALSIYRRAARLNEFFLQGRASYDLASSEK